MIIELAEWRSAASEHGRVEHFIVDLQKYIRDLGQSAFMQPSRLLPFSAQACLA
jgi:hypothetical protein